MKKHIKFLSLIMSLMLISPFCVFAEEEEIPVKEFNITVATDERQTYEGFGFSLVSDFVYNMPAADKEKAYTYYYDDLNVNALRLWFDNIKYFKEDENHSLSYFVNDYHKVGQGSMLDGAIKRGIEHFILAPSGGFPAYMKGEEINPLTGEIKNYTQIKPSMADHYAKGLAEAVYELRETYDVPITGTGIFNEPTFAVEVMIEIIPRLRKHLDELGCEDVFIIAPERANNDANSYTYLRALVENEDAKNNIDALSTHSYNMALTKTTASIVEESGITRFWQTESSTTGEETEEDFGNGITATARFLNDMNHRCTEWIHFQGMMPSYTNGVGLGGYTNGKFHMHQKYWYLKQLIETFQKGAVFYLSTSDVEGEMEFTYGKKNMVYCATAQNPDGTWSIGICNASDTTQHEWWMTRSSFYQDNALQKDTIANVTLNVLGLSQSGKQQFKVVRTSREGDLIAEENIVADGGIIKLTLNPCDLVTLVSVKPIEKAEVTTEIEYYEVQEMILPPKPEDMTDDQYQLWIQGSKVLGYDESKLPDWTPEYRTVIKERIKSGGNVEKNFVLLMNNNSVTFVNGEKKTFDEADETVTTVIKNGSTYVPIRFAEFLGGTVSMKEPNHSFTIKLGNYISEISVGSPEIKVNGVSKNMGAAPIFMNNRVYIPVRGFVEAVGKNLHWDDRGLIIITDNSEIEKLNVGLIQKFEPEKEPQEDEEPEEKINTTSIDKYITTLMLGNSLAYIGGEKKQFDETNDFITPIIIDGSTYVPVRFIEMIGGKTTVADDIVNYTSQIGDYEVKFNLGENTGYINGNSCSLGGVPQIINGRVYIPLRGFVENIGKSLKWDNRGLITITDNAEIANLVSDMLKKYLPDEEETSETPQNSENN